MRTRNNGLIIAAVALLPDCVFASGSGLFFIETPYVQQTEQELEYQLVVSIDREHETYRAQHHQLEFSQALSDSWSAGLSVTGINRNTEEFDLTSYELEAKLQLSEQGEYENDWGVVFELEREPDDDIWELGSTLIVARTWSRWEATGNFRLSYEIAPDDDELETAFTGQLKYRFKATLEPAIDYFKDEHTNALGFSLHGQHKLSGRRKLLWSAGLAASLDSRHAAHSIRLKLEYEF